MDTSPKRASVSVGQTDATADQVYAVEVLGNQAPVHVQLPYGLSSNPPKGTEGLMAPLNSDFANSAFLPYTGDKRVKNLAPGEVVISNPETGSLLEFKKDASATLKNTSGGQFSVNKDGKVALGNSAGELMDLFDKLLDQLSKATVATMLGPQLLDPATQTFIADTRLTLGMMKGVLT